MSQGEGSKAVTLPAGIITLIGADMQIVGNVSCRGTLRVQGTIIGNVHCQSPDDALVVDPPGAVTGEVKAPQVSTRGRIVGPVTSTRSIEVHEGGKITGDVSFKALAIHSGGVVEGTLNPLTADLEVVSSQSRELDGMPLPHDEATASAGRLFTPFRLALAAIVISIVAGASWLFIELTGGGSQPSAAAQVETPAASSDQTSVAALAGMAGPAQNSIVPPVAQSAPGAVSDMPMGPVEPPEEIVAVKGANPNRPTGVFLLISKDAVVLQKKKQDEAGEGARISIGASEKTSVSIADDEIIRIAKGRNATIYYQGEKVPEKLIANGTWIRFVPVR